MPGVATDFLKHTALTVALPVAVSMGVPTQRHGCLLLKPLSSQHFFDFA